MVKLTISLIRCIIIIIKMIHKLYKGSDDMRNKISGIYKIENKINHKVYIGQSKDLHGRKLSHLCGLRNGNHYNKHLQASIDKYGINNFSFTVIEKCDKDKLNDREVYWIAKYDSMNNLKGYNRESGGTVGKEVSESTKEMMRNYFEGEKSRTAVISEETAKDIISMLVRGDSIHGIAKKLGISHKIVESIRIKKTWKYLTENVDFPVKRSSKYKWVSRVPKTNVELYRALVKVDGKKVYDKCWDTEYDAAVAREIFIREHNLNATKNFADDIELTMPTKRIYAESKYIGVYRQSGNTGHWVASICKGHGRNNTEKIHVGSFKTEKEAAIAREKYIDEHFKDSTDITRNNIA